LPEGYVWGRVLEKRQKENKPLRTLKGYKWATNGLQRTLLSADQPLPEGYVWGRLFSKEPKPQPKSLAGSTWATNGHKIIRLPADQPLPVGYTHGRFINPGWWTNGQVQIQPPEGQEPPVGFVQGFARVGHAYTDGLKETWVFHGDPVSHGLRLEPFPTMQTYTNGVLSYQSHSSLPVVDGFK
jgi:hypothetical protein